MAITMNKVKHDIECDVCGKPAYVNIQQMWHRWFINDNGDYTGEKEWEGNDNNHYCEEHAKEEGII